MRISVPPKIGRSLAYLAGGLARFRIASNLLPVPPAGKLQDVGAVEWGLDHGVVGPR